LVCLSTLYDAHTTTKSPNDVFLRTYPCSYMTHDYISYITITVKSFLLVLLVKHTFHSIVVNMTRRTAPVKNTGSPHNNHPPATGGEIINFLLCLYSPHWGITQVPTGYMAESTQNPVLDPGVITMMSSNMIH